MLVKTECKWSCTFFAAKIVLLTDHNVFLLFVIVIIEWCEVKVLVWIGLLICTLFHALFELHTPYTFILCTVYEWLQRGKIFCSMFCIDSPYKIFRQREGKQSHTWLALHPRASVNLWVDGAVLFLLTNQIRWNFAWQMCVCVSVCVCMCVMKPSLMLLHLYSKCVTWSKFKCTSLSTFKLDMSWCDCGGHDYMFLWVW